MAAYFTKPDGTACKAGDVLKNPAYAATLRRLAAEGPSALYQGPIAADIAARVHADPMPGTLSAADIAAYRAHATPALCRPYRDLQGLHDQRPLGRLGPVGGAGPAGPHRHRHPRAGRPRGLDRVRPGSRLMYADRDRYIGDPAFVKVPTEGLAGPRLPGRPRQADRPRGRPAAGARPARAARRRSGRTARSSRAAPRTSSSSTRAATWPVDDHHGGEHVRLGPHGRRLRAQQPADRLLVLADAARTARRRPTRWRRASGRARRWRR